MGGLSHWLVLLLTCVKSFRKKNGTGLSPLIPLLAIGIGNYEFGERRGAQTHSLVGGKFTICLLHRVALIWTQ